MIFWGGLVFSRDFRRQEGAKFKIYLSFEDCRGFRCGSLFGAVVVSTGCRWSGSSGLSSLSWRVPSFCPLSRFVFGALPLKYAFIRVLKGFLEGFPCWMYACIACVLCVACVALYACGVRRFYGLLRVLPFVFFSCPLVLLSSCSPALLLRLVFGVACVVVVGFLSLSDE